MSHCTTCSPTCVILYQVTGSYKEKYSLFSSAVTKSVVIISTTFWRDVSLWTISLTKHSIVKKQCALHPFPASRLTFRREGVWWRGAKRVSLPWPLEFFRKNMTNYKVRKKLANQKWIHRSVYPCGRSEQAFGSRCADGLYRGFRDSVTRPASTQARRGENCQFTMFNWERSDTQGVGNLPHALTAKYKSSTFELSTTVLLKLQQTSSPIAGWLSKLKREQKIKTYLLCCRLHMGRVKYYKRVWLQADNGTTQRHLSVIKDQTSKTRLLEIKCVTLLDTNQLSRLFFGKTLSTDIAPVCCYGHDIKKKIAEIRALSRLGALPLDFTLAATLHTAAEPAIRVAVKT